MFKDITIDELAVGMFIERLGDGSFKEPFQDVRDYVHDKAAIARLRAEGVTTLRVDPEKAKAAPAAQEPSPATFAPGPPPGSMDAARKIYSHCLTHVMDVMEKVRQGYAVDYRQSYEAVDTLMSGVEENQAHMALLTKLQRYDDYTLRHSLNVSLISLIFGRRLGLDPGKLRRLGFSGLYHDVGKFRIPLEILNKPGRLSEREFEVMKHHSLIGYDLLKAQPGITEDVLLGVLNHHERFDGQGYPHNLRANEKDPFSRILTIADIFDALTSERSYKKAMTPHDSLKAMFSWRNESFHPGLLEKFVECFGVYPPGSLVRLSDQTCALVVETRPENPARPVVKVCFDRKLNPRPPVFVDLSGLPRAAEGGLDIETCLDPRTLNIQLDRFI